MQSSPISVPEIECFYRRFGPALLLYASAMTADRSGAEDAVHQVFLKLLRNGNLRLAEDAKAYLFTSVRNTVLSEAKYRERHVALDQDSAWFESSNQDGLEEELTLRCALLQLPEDQREVTVLHVWGGFTFGQVGQLLGISSNTAASRYRYALNKLRDAMTAGEDPYVKP